MVNGDDPLCKCTTEGASIFNRLFDSIRKSDKEGDIHNYISGTSLEYIGQGDGRVVLLDRSGELLNYRNACVVKINKYGTVIHNEREVNNWERLNEYLGHRLLRITDWDDNYRWVVQPYIDTEVSDEMLEQLEKDFLDHGMKAYDVNKRNCARVKDRAVLLDYDQPIEEIDFNIMAKDERERLIEWKYS